LAAVEVIFQTGVDLDLGREVRRDGKGCSAVLFVFLSSPAMGSERPMGA
jgi:hypothetical protein